MAASASHAVFLLPGCRTSGGQATPGTLRSSQARQVSVPCTCSKATACAGLLFCDLSTFSSLPGFHLGFNSSTRLLTPLACPTGRGRQSPPASSAGPGNSWTQDDFVDRCSRMVDQVRTSLGGHFAPFFDRPVDAKLVPDYYSVIKRPMDLGTLKQKLHDGHYSAPQQFAEVC